MPRPVIEAELVDKRYGPIRALHQASFTALAGEVHALVGENGAGKSTLIKVLCGVAQPDTGTLRVDGRPVTPAGPADATGRGVVTAFQELTLLPYLSVAENLLLDREPRNRLGLIRRRELAERTEATLAEYGVSSIDPNALVETLPLAQQQVIEVVRAVSGQPAVLLLDEPTSALAEREVDWLFDLVRRLCRAGTGVIFTSHRWREVATLADRITVFRGGRHVATRTELAEDEAITLMTGRAPTQRLDDRPPPRERVRLVVDGCSGGRLREVSLTAREGEILGIGGLAGQGQRELFLALFGVRPVAGEISVDGVRRQVRTPADAIRAGIALVPEDRKGEGLFGRLSVRENLTLPILSRIAGRGLLHRSAERAAVRGLVDQLAIGVRDLEQPVDTLSGGNQQKVLLGRWLLTGASVVLLYDVTRGVDIGTKREIFARVAELAEQGAAVLFYSSETEEIARMSHRVLVMREGRIAVELTGADITEERIVGAAVRDAAGPEAAPVTGVGDTAGPITGTGPAAGTAADSQEAR